MLGRQRSALSFAARAEPRQLLKGLRLLEGEAQRERVFAARRRSLSRPGTTAREYAATMWAVPTSGDVDLDDPEPWRPLRPSAPP